MKPLVVTRLLKFPLINKCREEINREEEVYNFGREKGPKSFCLV